LKTDVPQGKKRRKETVTWKKVLRKKKKTFLGEKGVTEKTDERRGKAATGRLELGTGGRGIMPYHARRSEPNLQTWEERKKGLPSRRRKKNRGQETARTGGEREEILHAEKGKKKTSRVEKGKIRLGT